MSTLVRHGRCLAALSPLQLLALTKDGTRPLWLDDLACAGCPIGQVQATLAASVAVANHLLAMVNRRERVHLAGAQDDNLRTKPVACTALDGQDPHYSRRGLFAAVSQRIKAGAVAGREKKRPEPLAERAGVNARLPHHTPQQRQQLSAWFERAILSSEETEPVDLTGLPLTQVTVDPDVCSACGLCARFCPTGALAFAADKGTFRLQFQVTACIDCEICQKACPERAIAFGDWAPKETLTAGHKQPLVAGDLVKCVVCGALTASHPDEESPARCHACRQSVGRVSSLADRAGLMADLLSRI